MSKTHTLSVIIIILSSRQHNDTLRWTDDKTMFFDRIMMISSGKLLVCPCKCHTCVKTFNVLFGFTQFNLRKNFIKPENSQKNISIKILFISCVEQANS